MVCVLILSLFATTLLFFRVDTVHQATFTVSLQSPRPNDPVSVFHQAQGFYLAGNRCLLDIEVGPGVTQCLVSPGVVNLCLSIELFLKALIIARGAAAPKSHKLVDLVAAVESSHIDAVRSQYAQVITTPAFDELLSEINDFFVKIRYGYEFDIFAFQEAPVSVLAKSLYLNSAMVHGIKVGIQAMRV